MQRISVAFQIRRKLWIYALMYIDIVATCEFQIYKSN